MGVTDISERNFEEAIERALLAGGPDDPASAGTVAERRLAYGESEPPGYHRRTSDEYDRSSCLLPRDVFDFLYATQPKEWEKFAAQHGTVAKERLLQRLSAEIASRGTLDVLRNGIKANGSSFRLAYFRPASGLNPALQTLYNGNIFSVVRQLRYSERTGHSLDLALFLNGVPLFTAELKNPLMGQTVQDAIRQYRLDRDPREPLFAFGRCLAHFAVDPDLVYMTTALDGPQTRFLPFNKGRNGGAGNPPVSPAEGGFATRYLWCETWARASVLELVQRFIHVVEEEDDTGRKTGKRSLIFPRYHQLDTVRRLVTDARTNGTGRRYLIQHSAGSGKSNSIAWLAHQLSVLHDAADSRVFDSIIVITDRRVLDRQLQRTVRQFEQTLGVVENIDTSSRQLKDALEHGKTIIVTTLQKFPRIIEDIEKMPGKRFAVIIDEAHSSQGGESPRYLKLVLQGGSLEEAEEEDQAVTADDVEDSIARTMLVRQFASNASYYAFTATPKPKTLELFGTRLPDGGFEAFSVYSMRQAIEEGFILDVLANYTTYHAYWSLLKTIEDDPRYDRHKAEYLLTKFVGLHKHTIARKVALIVEHFASRSASRIGGHAKAMIVTRSRLHAVRYKQVLDTYLQEHGYPYKALVAFSGVVKDDGKEFTEAGMNRIPEVQTAEKFKGDEYRFLIVANKFQTGFDQPLLHSMYVDKKLGGVNAVQTLSRLNRVHPGKEETFVLDFANEAEEIQKAFAPYYERTLLTEGTDPNLLYDLQTRLRGFAFYTEAEVNQVADLWWRKATQDRLHAALAPIIDRYGEATEDEQFDFRGQLGDYIRLYAFLSQILPFVDTDLEKLYQFARLLLRKLPIHADRLPVEVQQAIDVDSYRLRDTSSGKITLPRGESDVEPKGPVSGYALVPDEMEELSRIIRQLNDRFGTDFSEDDKLCIRDLELRLAENTALEASVAANSPENARLTFNHVVGDLLQGMVDGHFKFYKRVTDDPAFSRAFLDWLFERYLLSQQRDQSRNAAPDHNS